MAKSSLSKKEKIVYLCSVGVRLLLLGAILFHYGEKMLYSFPGGAGNLYTWLSTSSETFLNFDSGIRMPGYSVYLWLLHLVGLPIWAGSVVQIFIFSIMPILVMRTVRRIYPNSRAENIAGILTAFEPLQIFYSIQIMPDPFTSLLFFVGVYYLIRFFYDKNILSLSLSSIFLAVSNYLRPTVVYFFILIPIFIFLSLGWFKKRWKESLKFALVYGAIFFLILSPWMVRNYFRVGTFSFSVSSGWYIAAFTGTVVIAAEEHISFEEAQAKLFKEVENKLPYPDSLDDVRNSKVLVNKGLEVVFSHFRTFLKMYFLALQTYFISGNYHFILKQYNLISPPSHGQVSITRLFASDGVVAVWNRLEVFVTEPYGMIALLGRVFLGPVFLSSLIGAFWLLKKNIPEKLASLLFLVCIAYGAMTVALAVEGIEARHRLFLNPLIFTFAGIGVSLAVVWFKRKFRGHYGTR